MYLIKGEPAFRRRFMDTLLAQVSPYYLTALQAYSKALREKSAVLKRDPIDPDLLAVYNEQIARYGSRIVHIRSGFVNRLNKCAGDIFEKFSRKKDSLMIHYESFGKKCLETTEQGVYAAFLSALSSNRHTEKKRRMCLIGPHRDDIQIYVNGNSAKSFASEGQKRTAAFCMRLAEYEFAGSAFGEPPVILMDDVFGELDNEKKEVLATAIDPECQLFVTCTDVKNLGEFAGNARRFAVSEKKVVEIASK
jgi:DNA replication and repair protein RecF